MCLDGSLEQIRNMGSAEINLVMRQEALEAAVHLEKRYGTPYLYGTPYGYKGSLEWLESIGRLLGKKPSDRIVAELQKRIMTASQYRMRGRMLKRDNATAYVYGDAETVKGLSAFLGDMGIESRHCLSIHNISSLKELPKDITHIAKEKDRLEILKNLRSTLVLADDTSKRFLDKSNTYVRIANPMIDGSLAATHMPIAGIRGADMLMEYVAEYFNGLT